MFLNSIVFASPWFLGLLVGLPVLWWLLRLTPPSPRRVVFPALMLLRDLASTRQTSARTPWWLLLLRLAIAALMIVAFAQPRMNPLPAATSHGGLFIAVDNDWASARDWPERVKVLHDLLNQAAHDHRMVTLLPTASSMTGETASDLSLIAPEAATAKLHNLTPEPWPADWRHAAQTVKSLSPSAYTDIVWLTSGLGGDGALEFYGALQQLGNVRALGTKAPIYLLQPPLNDDDNRTLSVLRTDTRNAADLAIDAKTLDGNIVARLPLHFNAGAPHAEAPLDVPLDVRNQITRFEIEGQHSAGTVVLMDSEWEHRAVGLVGDPQQLEQHSLLDNLTYIDRALKPYAETHVAPLGDLLNDKSSVLILTDATPLNDADVPLLTAWIKRGGVLVRFAGERLAASENPAESEIMPVALHTGDRALGGALSWSAPQKLQAFPKSSPFQGLAIPDDVTVSRQILAEPSSDLAPKIWAALQDGTPLVTAKNLGAGVSVLFHVSAQADWSNLPLSGLFVEMLRRVVDLSRGMPKSDATFTALSPFRTLNGFGEDQTPAPEAQPIQADQLSATTPSPLHPPGLYGSSTYSVAFNLGAALGQPQASHDVPIEISQTESREIALMPCLLTAAFVLLLVDFLISLFMRGLIALPRSNMAIILGLAACLSLPQRAHAQINDSETVELTSKTYLAYVRTGERETDSTSAAGLAGLARMLEIRTSLDHVGVAAIDPDDDNLAFFPLLYWPLIAGEAPLTRAGAAHVNDYLRHGGMILFDAISDEEPSHLLLKQILRGVDLPPLVPLPDQHVLKHSFYLLDEFPGRFTGHAFWLEPDDASANDNVATVLYGSNDWAAAWALDNDGHPLYPCMPGGELQREHAFRFGINLVMYALTGNYKADQMHVQALLDKVGP